MKISEWQLQMLIDIVKDSINIMGVVGGFDQNQRIKLVNDLLKQGDVKLVDIGTVEDESNSMFFGKKLKEIRVHHAEIGLRKFADKMEMKVSEYIDMEKGFVPPPKDNGEWWMKLIYALEINDDMQTQLELLSLLSKPFIMQKMEESFVPAFVCTADGSSPTESAIRNLCDDMEKRAREHNRKADAYNKEHGVG